MQACVLTFDTRSGTGTQVISGVVDKDGTPFEGKVFIAVGGYSATDVLGVQAFGNYATMTMGVDNGTVRSAQSRSETVQFTTNKAVSTGDSANSFLLDTGANAFFGGDNFRQAYITSVSAGSFTLTYTTNDRTGDSYMVLVLGGSDLTVDLIASILGSHTYATSAVPRGVVAFHTSGSGFNNTGGMTTGAGGGQYGIAWDTPTSGRGGAWFDMRTNGGNARYQTALYSTALFSASSTAVTRQNAVAAWGASDFTTGTYTLGPVVALGGTDIRCTAGSFNQPTTDGQQTIELGVNAAAVLFSGTGTATTTAADLSMGTLTVGMMTATDAANFWTGETLGFGGTLTGTRMLTTGSVMTFAVPNGASTVFGPTATVVSLSSTGTLVLEWTGTDSTAREVLWFAMGTASDNAITVNKTIVGPPASLAATFDFTTTGGLTPSTFTLGDGESQAFSGLASGTYGVTETANANYATTYTVSNGDPHTAIVVDTGETVTVDVVNTYILPDDPSWTLYRFDIKYRTEQRA